MRTDRDQRQRRRGRTCVAMLLGVGLVGVFSRPAQAVDQANLSVSIADSADPVAHGSTVTYTVTITNNGPNAASNVALTDLLADKHSTPFLTQGSVIVGASISGGSGGSCDVDSEPLLHKTAVCTLSTLSAASGSNVATATIDVAAQLNTFVVAQPTGLIVNTATVRSDAVDSTPSDNVDTETTGLTP